MSPHGTRSWKHGGALPDPCLTPVPMSEDGRRAWAHMHHCVESSPVVRRDGSAGPRRRDLDVLTSGGICFPLTGLSFPQSDQTYLFISFRESFKLWCEHIESKSSRTGEGIISQSQKR